MRLGVNVDHYATIRQARRTYEPDPVAAVILADLAGADGIVCHLREDRRHINDNDLARIRQTVKSVLNMEMAPTDEMVKIAMAVKPEIVTLVPEKREEVTTEGGLNVTNIKPYLQEIIPRLKQAGIQVSVFVDPDIRQIKECALIGADSIELHTGTYSNAKSSAQVLDELNKIKVAAAFGKKSGLFVAAGHGLNYHNVKYIAQILDIEELNIGHSIVARASLVGLERAVKEMVEIVKNEYNLSLIMSR